MKIYHYCFHIEDTNTHELYPFDLKPFLKAFTNWDTSMQIASNVVMTGDKIFLLPVDGIENFYLFVSAKTNDAVQKIKKTADNIHASNILKELEEDTNIGFASYIFFDPSKNIFSFASRLGAPTAAGFKNFMHYIFSRLNLGALEFKIEAIQESLDKAEASNLPVIGRTSITVNKDNELFKLIADYLIGNSIDRDLIEGIQVTIKPELKQNIRDSAKNAINRLKLEGLESIRMQAKRIAEDEKRLKEYRVIEKGNITNEVKSFDTTIIHQEMKDAIKLSIIEKKYAEYIKETEFCEDELKDLTHFYNAANWRNV
ncbi:exclusion protein [Acinetobacter seifertii]|uniref:exclusion protein n=1 Tax=Acinetobacter seifertii TaxID=1530123 RepID=UPI001D174C11|nr:exclusion protein [Acinetobacter seifertii]